MIDVNDETNSLLIMLKSQIDYLIKFENFLSRSKIQLQDLGSKIINFRRIRGKKSKHIEGTQQKHIFYAQFRYKILNCNTLVLTYGGK